MELKEVDARLQATCTDWGIFLGYARKHTLAEAIVKAVMHVALSLNGKTVLAWIGIDLCLLGGALVYRFAIYTSQCGYPSGKVDILTGNESESQRAIGIGGSDAVGKFKAREMADERRTG